MIEGSVHDPPPSLQVMWLLCPVHWDRPLLVVISLVWLMGLAQGWVLANWLGR